MVSIEIYNQFVSLKGRWRGLFEPLLAV